MKKAIAIALTLVLALSILVLAGCNKQMVDLTYSYEYAIKTYLVHSSNVVLISD